MALYKIIYGKSCHLPLEKEHRAYWDVKKLNFDFKEAVEKCTLDLHALEQFGLKAYENAKIFKEKIKNDMTRRFKRESFIL